MIDLAGDPTTEQLLFTQSTVAMVDRAVPGNQSLDDKVRKIVNTVRFVFVFEIHVSLQNKAIRTQLEEAEQALHTRRTNRIEADKNVNITSSYEEQQSELVYLG